MAPLATNVKSSSGTIAANTLGRKFQNPNVADCPTYIKRFAYTNDTGAALPDGTVIDLGPVLGPGVILQGSFIQCTALGASRVLNLGNQEYTNQQDNSVVAASINSLIAALDVSSQKSAFLGNVAPAAVQQTGFQTAGAFSLLAQVTGGTIPAAAVISGYVVLSKPL